MKNFYKLCSLYIYSTHYFILDYRLCAGFRMVVSEPTLNCLAAAISETTKALTAYLEQNGHSTPSFEEGGLEQYPKDAMVTGLRFQLLEAASDLYHLALGPADMGFLQPLFVSISPCRQKCN